jgi:methyl-accepting chemotaxis protein
MSLQLRILLPFVLLALVGLGAALVISTRALELYDETRGYIETNGALGEAVGNMMAQIDSAGAELEQVIEMNTLFDTNASWAEFEGASAQIVTHSALIGSLPVSAAMLDLIGDLDAAFAAFHHDAAVLYGKVASSEIPTREQMTRREAQIRAITGHILDQARADAKAFAELANARFNGQIRLLIEAVVVINLIVLAGAALSVRRTSRKIKEVATNLVEMAGSAAQGSKASRDEILGMQRAAQAFAQRAIAIRSFQEQLATAVEAAVAGDFSLRLQVTPSEPDLRQIADQMNQLMQGVEAALSETSDVLTRIAQGDLSARILGNYQGVLLDLKRHTNATAEQLYQIVTGIDGATRKINDNMKMIVNGSNSLADRTRQQVLGLETVRTSMAAMTRTANDATRRVDEAWQVSNDTAARAVAGDQVAEETTQAISAIEDSARRINEVNEAVEGLSFQTNILAINAAVEAARAGEAGKGFAIVAQEVRSLAMRSSEAARMIASLTAETVTQIAIGAKKVQASREGLGRIRLGIEALNASMKNIDEMSRDQLASFQHLSKTITQLDRETQMNASLAHDSVVAATDVDGQANRLQDQMAIFRLGAAKADAGHSPVSSLAKRA